MDTTLLALLVMSVILLGLHAPYAVLALVVILTLAILATQVSWSVLQSLEPARVSQHPNDQP